MIMSAPPLHLAVFALLSLAAAAAAAVAVCAVSDARRAAGLGALGALVAAIAAGFLGAGLAAAGMLLATVSGAGLTVALAARLRPVPSPGEEMQSRGGPRGRLSAAVSSLAVAVLALGLTHALAGLGPFLDRTPRPAAAEGGVGLHLAGPGLLPFLLLAYLVLAGVCGVVAARRASAGPTADGGGRAP